MKKKHVVSKFFRNPIYCWDETDAEKVEELSDRLDWAEELLLEMVRLEHPLSSPSFFKKRKHKRYLIERAMDCICHRLDLSDHIECGCGSTIKDPRS